MRGRPSGIAIGGVFRRKAGGCQRAQHIPRDPRFIFNDQNPHSAAILPKPRK
jgi:hypothetical protein